MDLTLWDVKERIAAERGIPRAPGFTLRELAARNGVKNHELRTLKKVLNREVRAGHVVCDTAGLYTLAPDGLAPDVRLALRELYS